MRGTITPPSIFVTKFFTLKDQVKKIIFKCQKIKVSPSKPLTVVFFPEVTTEQFAVYLSRPYNVLQLDFIT